MSDESGPHPHSPEHYLNRSHANFSRINADEVAPADEQHVPGMRGKNCQYCFVALDDANRHKKCPRRHELGPVHNED